VRQYALSWVSETTQGQPAVAVVSGPGPTCFFLTRISHCQCDSTRTRGRCLGPAFCEPAGGRRPRRARGLDHSNSVALALAAPTYYYRAGSLAGTVT
jgi:hypothetical protein